MTQGAACTYPRAPSPPPCQARDSGLGRRPAECPPGGKCSGPCSALPTSSSAAAGAPGPSLPKSLCEAAKEQGQSQCRVGVALYPPDSPRGWGRLLCIQVLSCLVPIPWAPGQWAPPCTTGASAPGIPRRERGCSPPSPGARLGSPHSP